MKIAIHAGVFGTDDDQLTKCLLRNRDVLLEKGVSVPGPSRYRRELRHILDKMSYESRLDGQRETLLNGLDGPLDCPRLLLTNPNYFSVPRRALARNRFYPNADMRLAATRDLFQEDQVEIFLGLCNPAIFVPKLEADAPGAGIYEVFRDCDPEALHWSEMLYRMRAAAPNIPITVWCHEDTPLIWPEVLHRICGLETPIPLEGEYAILRQVMHPNGLEKLRDYMARNSTLTDQQRREVTAAFLERHALDDYLETEIHLPGWTQETVDTLTRIYEEDLERIALIEGVRFIRP